MSRWFWITIFLIFFYNIFIKEEKKPVFIPSYAPIYQSPIGTEGGYECTVDCSGHEAGYRWAEDNDIDDPDDCYGNSQSFIEGCRQYADEH